MGLNFVSQTKVPNGTDKNCAYYIFIPFIHIDRALSIERNQFGYRSTQGTAASGVAQAEVSRSIEAPGGGRAVVPDGAVA